MRESAYPLFRPAQQIEAKPLPHNGTATSIAAAESVAPKTAQNDRDRLLFLLRDHPAGLTDEEMAKFFDVKKQTLNNWKSDYPEFFASLKEGKVLADGKVVASLYHRALGYSHPEDDIRAIAGEVVITPTIKHYPPDTTACIFWLKNRRKDQWRDVQEKNYSGTVTLEEKPQQLGDDRLNELGSRFGRPLKLINGQG